MLGGSVAAAHVDMRFGRGETNSEGAEMNKSLHTFACLTTLALSTSVAAQQSTTYETGPDGMQYRVTRQVVQRSIPTTEYQTREQKVYRPQVTTQYQSYQQTYLTPVTQYQWVARLNGRWNPFVQPYWTHELAPVTTWQAKPATVQVPVARTDWVEETRTAQVPVTTYRTAQEEYITKVAVGASPTSSGATSVASRPAPIGGQQLSNDPPATASPWATGNGGETYRR
jgi:hypothetical protein